MSWLFPSGGQSIGTSASVSVLPMIIQYWSPLGLTGLMPLQSEELSRVISNATVQMHQFFSTQLSLWSNSHIHTWLLEKPSVQFISVAQSCPTLCDPMDCSTPGLPVHHRLPESTQTHVHWVWCHPTIASSVIPFSSRLQSFPASGSFPMSQFFASGGQSIGVSASNSFDYMHLCQQSDVCFLICYPGWS